MAWHARLIYLYVMLSKFCDYSGPPSYLYIIIRKKYKQRIVHSYVCFFIMKLSDSICVYSLQKSEKICLLLLKCSFLFTRRRVSVIYFCASNGFKMEDKNPTPSGDSCQQRSDSSSLSSGSSSSSLDSSSSSSYSSESNPVITKMDKSKADEIKVLEPYPKNTENQTKDIYRGLEHGIVYACCQQLYVNFEVMKTEFSEFVA